MIMKSALNGRKKTGLKHGVIIVNHIHISETCHWLQLALVVVMVRKQILNISKIMIVLLAILFSSNNFSNNLGWSFHPIALHEIGHLLGLDHSYDRASVMYFESYADGLRNDLHHDDIRGITCLYGDELCEEFQFATTPAFSKFNLRALFLLEGEKQQQNDNFLFSISNLFIFRY